MAVEHGLLVATDADLEVVSAVVAGIVGSTSDAGREVDERLVELDGATLLVRANDYVDDGPRSFGSYDWVVAVHSQRLADQEPAARRLFRALVQETLWSIALVRDAQEILHLREHPEARVSS